MPDGPAQEQTPAEDAPRKEGAGLTARQRLGLEVRGWLKSLFFALVLVLVFRAHIAEGYQIRGNSMQPTLEDSDRLFVEKITHHARSYAPGDIVVFPHPKGGKKLIKRVVAVGGQVVEIRDGHLYVDGAQIEEAYVDDKNRDLGEEWGPQEVDPGTLFVLGDNRDHSNDSRSPLGFIAEDVVVGRAFVRFWPVTRAKLFP